MVSLSILFTFILSTSVYGQNCDASFPTLEYNGNCYATLTGFDPTDTSIRCEGTLSTLPSGWEIAPAGADTTAVITNNNWGTNNLVYGYPSQSSVSGETFDATPSAAGGCFGTCFVVYDAGTDLYRASSCNQGVLIIRSEVELTMNPTVNQAADPGTIGESGSSESMSDSVESSDDAPAARSNEKEAEDILFLYGEDGDIENDNDMLVITINLSKRIMANLWLMVAAVCILNGFIFFICRYYAKRMMPSSTKYTS